MIFQTLVNFKGSLPKKFNSRNEQHVKMDLSVLLKEITFQTIF